MRPTTKDIINQAVSLPERLLFLCLRICV